MNTPDINSPDMNTPDANAPDAPSAQPTLSPRKNRWNWLVAGALCLAAAWYISQNAGHWKDRFVPRKLRTVDAGRVYASGQINRHLIRSVLADDHIDVIVCLDADSPSDLDATEEIQAARDNGIQRFVDPLNGDGTGDIHAYADAIAQTVAALKANKTVLLHCFSGVQRSNGATFFFRVFIEGWNADDAAREMKKNWFSPTNNPVLIPYLNDHMAEMAQLLVDKGIIPKIPDPMPHITQ